MRGGAASWARRAAACMVGLLGALGIAASLAPAAAQTLDKVSFGTNWVAEAEHGGFYQALVDGTYRKYGLDVTIVLEDPTSTTASCCRSASSTSS